MHARTSNHSTNDMWGSKGTKDQEMYSHLKSFKGNCKNVGSLVQSKPFPGFHVCITPTDSITLIRHQLSQVLARMHDGDLLFGDIT